METLFLVALATAKRFSELQALSYHIVVQGDDVMPSCLPEFEAKTKTAVNPVAREFQLQPLISSIKRQ